MIRSAPIVYQAHPVTGEYMGSAFADVDPMVVDNWLIPALSFSKAPPAVCPGFVAIHVKGSEQVWSLIRDARGTVYQVESGESVQWQQLGELPPELTNLPRPGNAHIWDGSAWCLDEQLQHDSACIDERFWRDREIGSVIWLRERHRDESDLDFDTTLTGTQFSQLLSYLQALRVWPQQAEFPALAYRPERPDWIGGFIQ